MIAAHALACIIEKQPEFREPESFDKYACPLFQREMLFPSSKAVFCTDILDILEQAASASVYRMSRDADQWRMVCQYQFHFYLQETYILHVAIFSNLDCLHY